MIKSVRIILLLITLISFDKAKGQDTPFRVRIFNVEDSSAFSLVNYDNNVNDSAEGIREINKVIDTLRRKGYPYSRIKTFKDFGDSLYAYLDPGRKYHWEYFRFDNVDKEILDASGIETRELEGDLFDYEKMVNLENRILRYLEDNGYPFAKIRLDSIKIDTISAIGGKLTLEKGPFIEFDSLIVKGKSGIKPGFLASYLRISKGSPFNQELIERIPERIDKLPYLKLRKEPALEFRNDKAFLYLYLEKQDANQFDGVLGVLPGEGTNQRLLITGDIQLNLRNLFNSGKNLSLEWQRQKSFSQILDVRYEHPNILGSYLNAEGGLHLYKEDTTFLNVEREIGFSYNFFEAGKIGFSALLKTSNLISTKQFENINQSPPVLDYNFTQYSVSYQWNNLDDIYFPMKGHYLQLKGGAGNKVINKNNALPGEIYEDLNLKTLQWKAKMDYRYFFKIGKQATLLGRLQGGIIESSNLLLNDLFRLGGINDLRGFNEDFFFASRYGIATLEYRFFTGPESYFLVFYDQGYTYYDISSRYLNDFPRGAGAGVTFSTKTGVFNFVYSLGEARDQDFSFNLSKIHFGLTSKF